MNSRRGGTVILIFSCSRSIQFGYTLLYVNYKREGLFPYNANGSKYSMRGTISNQSERMRWLMDVPSRWTGGTYFEWTVLVHILYAHDDDDGVEAVECPSLHWKKQWATPLCMVGMLWICYVLVIQYTRYLPTLIPLCPTDAFLDSMHIISSRLLLTD